MKLLPTTIELQEKKVKVTKTTSYKKIDIPSSMQREDIAEPSKSVE